MALDRTRPELQDHRIEHPAPILRIFRAVPRPGATDELTHRFGTESVDLARSQPGMLACLAGGAIQGNDDLVFLTAWRDQHALRAFTGPDSSSAVLPPGYETLLAHHTISHRPLLTLFIPAPR